MDIYEQMKRAEAARAYAKSVLSAGGLEAWEAKEYTTLEKMYAYEIEILKVKIAELENMPC